MLFAEYLFDIGQVINPSTKQMKLTGQSHVSSRHRCSCPVTQQFSGHRGGSRGNDPPHPFWFTTNRCLTACTPDAPATVSSICWGNAKSNGVAAGLRNRLFAVVARKLRPRSWHRNGQNNSLNVTCNASTGNGWVGQTVRQGGFRHTDIFNTVLIDRKLIHFRRLSASIIPPFLTLQRRRHIIGIVLKYKVDLLRRAGRGHVNMYFYNTGH